MKIHYGKALSLGLVLSFASQLSTAAVLKDTPSKVFQINSLHLLKSFRSAKT